MRAKYRSRPAATARGQGRALGDEPRCDQSGYGLSRESAWYPDLGGRLDPRDTGVVVDRARDRGLCGRSEPCLHPGNYTRPAMIIS
jgi:hypothetical protein